MRLKRNLTLLFPYSNVLKRMSHPVELPGNLIDREDVNIHCSHDDVARDTF